MFTVRTARATRGRNVIVGGFPLADLPVLSAKIDLQVPDRSLCEA
jgi:hypothetical protein